LKHIGIVYFTQGSGYSRPVRLRGHTRAGNGLMATGTLGVATLATVASTSDATISDWRKWWFIILMGVAASLFIGGFVLSVLGREDRPTNVVVGNNSGIVTGIAGRDVTFQGPVTNVLTPPAEPRPSGPIEVIVSASQAFEKRLRPLPSLEFWLIELQAVRIHNPDPARTANVEFWLLATTEDGIHTYEVRAIPKGSTDLEWLRNVSMGHQLPPIAVAPGLVLPIDSLCFALTLEAFLDLENSQRSIPNDRLRLRVHEIATDSIQIKSIFGGDLSENT
jgi:hypothetical protein